MMKNIIKWLPLASVVFLAGCMGPQASFSEKMKDTFLLTSAENVSSKENKCITLSKPYSFKAGVITYSLPAGRYVAKRKRKTGYFYYAPKLITTSNSFFFPYQQGIYLDNQLDKGNVFGRNPDGYADRPIRSTVLPDAIFAYIKRKTRC